ncbi:MAG: hypothetical protein ABJB74_01185 [Gemmatimonas sp.]
MQAPSKSKAVAADAPNSASVLLPTLVALVATVTLLLLFAPNIVPAQVRAVTPPVTPAKTPATKDAPVSGSAQGALAAQTADKSDVAAKEAPKALPKGSKPSAQRSVAAPADATAKAKAQFTVTSAVTLAESLGTADSTDGMAFDELVNTTGNKIWGADLATQRGARAGEVSTIFQGRTYDPVETEEAVLAVLPPKTARPRSSEYASAPYAVAVQNLLHAGAVGRRAGSDGSFRGIERMVMMDEAEVILPAGTPAVVGARFVAVDVDALIKPNVQMVSPTAVFEIVKVEEGRPVIARVVQQTGRVEEGQKLLSLDGSAVARDVVVKSVARAATAPETDVAWVSGDALLPSVQTFLMLRAGSFDGVVAGDQFALVKRLGLGPDAVEQRVAVVRVVRVTAFGSTAIVIRQDQPGIAVGGAARLVARVQ